jgi:hypothetical protein
VAVRMDAVLGPPLFMSKTSHQPDFLCLPSGTKPGTKPLLFPRQEWLNPSHFLMHRENREMDSNLYGVFPVKWLFLVLLPVLCSEREGRSSSRRLRSGSRSARKGSRDRNGSTAWRLAA